MESPIQDKSISMTFDAVFVWPQRNEVLPIGWLGKPRDHAFSTFYQAWCCNTLWIICGTSHAELPSITNLHCDIWTTLTELYISKPLNLFCQSTYYLYYTETKLRWINYYECNVLADKRKIKLPETFDFFIFFM